MNIFRRLFKIGEAHANKAVDNLEDPITMTEQGIRDMKEDLNKSVEAMAQVKALAIRSKNDLNAYQEKAKDYEQKAVLILKKAQKGDISTDEADRLAKEALLKKEETQAKINQTQEETEKYEKNVEKLKSSIDTIKGNITKWENELKTLKARVKVSDATKNVNKQMAELDSAGTVSMLERMKEKVAQEEALAEAYGEMADQGKSIDQELDEAASSTDAQIDDELERLKKQLNS
ncbi:phage-shock protein [Nonlabens sp. MIC269]|uniref:PspA/IM30 family protein n=1 Tax=Nonlabens TaxID=363408 RepID=UPI000720869C|nr:MULTISPECIES: PspA/IM30 family protein [Nonlabens]ALM21099.1 phage-shock protein [Nonlabens sp. MIC269]ARN72181.1 phage shock protein A [Nonlabens tegetincola]MEE2802763.1 PspA/IM30 family protein [Bacteroidota bacterium]PQJ20203.1 phage shock protein A [Nonlabens tegetincola]